MNIFLKTYSKVETPNLIMIFRGKYQLLVLYSFFLESGCLLKKLFKLELFLKLAQNKLESLY